MQATIREHRDNGQSGGFFSRYNIMRVNHFDHKQKPTLFKTKPLHLKFLDSKSAESTIMGTICTSKARDIRREWTSGMRTYALPWQFIH